MNFQRATLSMPSHDFLHAYRVMSCLINFFIPFPYFFIYISLAAAAALLQFTFCFDPLPTLLLCNSLERDYYEKKNCSSFSCTFAVFCCVWMEEMEEGKYAVIILLILAYWIFVFAIAPRTRLNNRLAGYATQGKLLKINLQFCNFLHISNEKEVVEGMRARLNYIWMEFKNL